MESWDEESEILRSMNVILDIEAEAAKRVKAKEGLMPLLRLLRQYQVRDTQHTHPNTNTQTRRRV